MRLYRSLLFLYPKSFREEYGEEMRHVFASRRRLASGPIAVLALWIATIADVLINALRVHGDILRQDLHYTARTLARTPGFTATAVIVTALGIGANTAAFSVTDRVLVRPLPFDDADRLVKLWQGTPAYARMELSPPNFRDWRDTSTSFASMGAFVSTAVTLTGQGEPQRLNATAMTAGVFPTLRASAAFGRLFAPDEDRENAAPVAVLSHELWQTGFGGDPAIIGRTIRLTGVNAVTYAIVGVMPRGFYFPNRETEIWVPLKLHANLNRSDNYLQAIARLKPRVSLETARAEMATVALSLQRAYPKENEKTTANVIPLRDEMSSQARLLLAALFGASLCLLLIACTNLANLLLTRFLARRTELAVRAAMGAGRDRLVRQLLTESLVLSAAGGLLGFAIATAAVPLLAHLVPPSLPLGDPDAFDPRVLLFALLATGVTGILFGVVPAIRVCRGTDAAALRERATSGTTRRGERLRGALVLGEVAATIVLLVAGGLLLRALWRVRAVDPGFDAENVLTLRTSLPWTQYGKTDVRAQFYDRVLADVRALPGVAGAGYISFLPMAMRGGIWPVTMKGMPQVAIRGTSDSASLRFVTPGFFSALGIPIRRGRDVADSDTRDAPFVAIVSDSFVRKYWPDQDPIGRTFTFALAERTVVGVVGDIRVRGLERESEPQVYLAYKQVRDGSIMGYVPKDLVVKTAGDPQALVPAIRSLVRKADPALPITDVRLLADLVDAETAPRQTQVRVLSAFVAIALLLAAVGIHGLLAFGVSRRRTEIGLRMALGAQRRDVLRMILRDGVVLAAAGSVVGMILAYGAGRAMQALLAGVPAADVVTFGVAAAVAVLMTISGSVVPALRALRIDPAKALRAE